MSVGDRIVLAAGGAALLLVLLAGGLLLAAGDDTADDLALIVGPSASPPAAVTAPVSAAPSELVVDVEGGVLRPGLRRLPLGSRVADAVAAGGGYGPDADIDAAARELNLAAPLTDGQQVYVPRLGDGASAGAPAAEAGGGGDGLVNLNSATPEELDALPRIGPVTVQKIVAARQERPFASLEEAVERGVLNRGQLEEIRDLATAG